MTSRLLMWKMSGFESGFYVGQAKIFGFQEDEEVIEQVRSFILEGLIVLLHGFYDQFHRFFSDFLCHFGDTPLVKGVGI